VPADEGSSRAPPDLRDIGAALRRMGLTQNALLAWAGTHRLSALARIVPALAARPITPASAVLALFVAGVDVPLARLRGLPIDALVAHGLVEVAPVDASPVDAPVDHAREPRPLARDHVRARVAIMPLEQTLAVCDRFDAPSSRELVLCPDDSSYHLASAIPPGRRERWIDLATGSAFAPLARPNLAAQIVGIDLNPRAVELARLGAALSGCAQVTARCADIGDAPARTAHDASARTAADNAERTAVDSAERTVDTIERTAVDSAERTVDTAERTAADSAERTVDTAERTAADSAERTVDTIERAAVALDSRAQLVTCNAPILGDPDLAIWRATDRAFFQRLWHAARACVAPGGDVIVHCVLDGVPDTRDFDVIERERDGAADLALRRESEIAGSLEGEVVIVVYTPMGERPYCVVWWAPDGPARRVIVRRALTPARPHLDARDRDDARDRP
jgi:hypothetical protein